MIPSGNLSWVTFRSHASVKKVVGANYIFYTKRLWSYTTHIILYMVKTLATF